MAEELPLARAHLEEAAVLTVLGVRPVPGLAAGDLERLLCSTDPKTWQIAFSGERASCS